MCIRVKCFPHFGAVECTEMIRFAMGFTPHNLTDLDRLAEAAVFKNLAKDQQKQLSCTLHEARQLRDEPLLSSAAVTETCGKLSLLQDLIKNEAYGKESSRKIF